MNFESARRWIPNAKSLHDKFVAFPVLEVDKEGPHWLLSVIRKPLRLRSGENEDLFVRVDPKDPTLHQRLSFWVNLMQIRFLTWARNKHEKVKAPTVDATAEGYSSECDAPKPEYPLHLYCYLLRDAAKLAKDPEGFPRVTGDHGGIVDDIVPEEIMTERQSDIEQTMGTSMCDIRKRKRAGSDNDERPRSGKVRG
ncbi:MAG: hypothetical protein M1819_000808 [Sarea resinae]|nr:MAG: hypothetical protein M1819_000808 [Sarea resinae]